MSLVKIRHWKAWRWAGLKAALQVGSKEKGSKLVVVFFF